MFSKSYETKKNHYGQNSSREPPNLAQISVKLRILSERDLFCEISIQNFIN